MSRIMEDIDADPERALEDALGMIESGDESSSGGDSEVETPAPVRVERADTEGSLLSASSFQQGVERAMENMDGSTGGGVVVEGQTHRTCHIPRSQITLDVIFEDYKLSTMFWRFLKDQCILRNFNFWLACNHYHQLPSGTAEYQRHLVNVANAINVKYIKSSAPQLVPLKTSTKRIIKSILELNPKTISPSLFKPAQDEVWKMMEQNEMRQFLASDVFGEMFGDVEDSLSMDLAFTPLGPVLRAASPLHQSSSEDSVSVTSCSTDGGGSELGRTRNRLRPPFPRHSHRTCSSDTEAKSHHGCAGGPHAKKDKPVSKEDFVAMVYERLSAVQKDRDHMRKRAQEQARQQGRSYDDIIATEWYDLPNPVKYIQFELPPQRVGTLRGINVDKTAPDFCRNGISPSHSPSLAPYPNSQSKPFIDSLARCEIQDALKDLEITTQVSRSRRYHSTHPRSSSAASSILSYTSDSGVGDSVPWGTTGSRLATTNNKHVQRFVEGQNQLMTQTPQRDIDAKAAAITLISSSPHPEDLSHRVSLSGRHRLQHHPLSRRNYPGAYSSDDNTSFLTVTSESDLFIPRRYPPTNYESDEPQHFPRPHQRQLSRPRSTRFKMNQAPPIVEPSHTPSSHSQSPHPSGPGMTQKSSGVLVLYDLIDISAPAVKQPPFAKKHPTQHITLAEFKEKIFSRRGDYRFFFKSFCEEIDDAIMEEISDEETVLPHFEGKIIARVETVA